MASFVVGVPLRYRDDRCGRWMALVAYYGLFSIFPLLLSFVTVLGLVLEGNPELADDIINSALGNFPVIGTQLGDEEGLSGSPIEDVYGVFATVMGLLTWIGFQASVVLLGNEIKVKGVDIDLDITVRDRARPGHPA